MRKRLGILLLLTLALPALVLAQQAQQTQQGQQNQQSQAAPKPEQKPPEDAQKSPPAPAKTWKSPYPPAPKPGHALDPADVDTLTGKNKTQPYSGSYGVLVDPYGGYGSNRSIFTTPGEPGSRFTTPGQYGYGPGTYMSPLAIGRRNSHINVLLRRGFVFF